MVWLVGFIVYDVGMFTEEMGSLVGNIPMAVIYAFGMFLLNCDVSAIHAPFHSSGWFMFAFSSVHLFAALVCLRFVVKHFGFNIMGALKRNTIGTRPSAP